MERADVDRDRESLTSERLAELERLEKEATPGPWVYDEPEMLLLPHPSKMRDGDREGWCGEAAGHNDGRLCVALRNNAEALLQAARERDRMAKQHYIVGVDYGGSMTGGDRVVCSCGSFWGVRAGAPRRELEQSIGHHVLEKL